MFVKILSTVLILLVVFMGFKQGYGMLTIKPQMLEMFGKWGFNKTGIAVNGIITILSAILILFPRTFIWGNFIMAAGILLIMCFELLHKDFKGAAIELPFLLLNLAILYLNHPLNKVVAN